MHNFEFVPAQLEFMILGLRYSFGVLAHIGFLYYLYTCMSEHKIRGVFKAPSQNEYHLKRPFAIDPYLQLSFDVLIP